MIGLPASIRDNPSERVIACPTRGFHHPLAEAEPPAKTLRLLLTSVVLLDCTIDLTGMIAFQTILCNHESRSSTPTLAVTRFVSQTACFGLARHICHQHAPRYPTTTSPSDAEILAYGASGDGGPASSLAEKHTIPRLALLLALVMMRYAHCVSSNHSAPETISTVLAWLITRAVL